jgi:predicted phage-related endonuclease
MDDSHAIDIHPVTDACWSGGAAGICPGRPKLINASENACLHGLDPYNRTLAQLTAGKRDPKHKIEPDSDSEVIQRGHALEDDAVDAIRKLCPTWQISLNKNHYVDQRHRMACIPDALVIDPARDGTGVLQIKVVARQIFKQKWDDETPPTGFLLQLAQEMMLVPGCTWGAVGALVIGDFTFRAHVYPVERNRQAEIRIRTTVAEFWQAFDRGDIPAIDFERDGALIELMYPTATPGKVIDLSRDNLILELLERREILKTTVKDIEARLQTCETEIKAKLGDAEAAVVPGWRVTLKQQHRKEHMVAASSFRALRTTRTGEQQPQKA